MQMAISIAIKKIRQNWIAAGKGWIAEQEKGCRYICHFKVKTTPAKREITFEATTAEQEQGCNLQYVT